MVRGPVVIVDYRTARIPMLQAPIPTAAGRSKFTPAVSLVRSAGPAWENLPCFNRRFWFWHAICESRPMMRKNQLPDSDATVEPAPLYASDADIELAQQLRHQLEERYLGPSQAPSPLRYRKGDNH
jgi:hypothetical protein